MVHRCAGQTTRELAQIFWLSEWCTSPLLWRGRRSCRACSRASSTKVAW